MSDVLSLQMLGAAVEALNCNSKVSCPSNISCESSKSGYGAAPIVKLGPAPQW